MTNQKTKIKLTIGRLVGKPEIRTIPTADGPVQQITGYAFLSAFNRLASDLSLSVKDRYAIMRTKREIMDRIAAYEQFHADIPKQFGVKKSELLRRELEKAQREVDNPEGRDPKPARRRIELIDKQLAAIEAKPDRDIMTIPDDGETEAKCLKLINDQQATEFELEYLDHQIVLAKDTCLSANDMFEIIELVAPPLEE